MLGNYIVRLQYVPKVICCWYHRIAILNAFSSLWSQGQFSLYSSLSPTDFHGIWNPQAYFYWVNLCSSSESVLVIFKYFSKQFDSVGAGMRAAMRRWIFPAKIPAMFLSRTSYFSPVGCQGQAICEGYLLSRVFAETRRFCTHSVIQKVRVARIIFPPGCQFKLHGCTIVLRAFMKCCCLWWTEIVCVSCECCQRTRAMIIYKVKGLLYG